MAENGQNPHEIREVDDQTLPPADLPHADPAPAPAPLDNVNTKSVEVEVVPPRKKRLSPGLTARHKRQAAQGVETRNKVWELCVRRGMSISKAAEQIGLTYSAVFQAYAKRLDEMLEAEKPAGPNADRLRLELDNHLRDALESSKEQMDEDPRYAAIMLKTLEQLAKLHGLDKPQEQKPETSITAGEISDKLKLMSPALAGRREQLERILESRERNK